jgi:hypothetical protein
LDDDGGFERDFNPGPGQTEQTVSHDVIMLSKFDHFSIRNSSKSASRNLSMVKPPPG